MLKTITNLVNVSQIVGVLPVLNGGTGVTTSTGTGNNVLSAAPTLSGNVTLSTGNLIIASGQGIDFSATPGTGTSELLDDYEEGTWTPSVGGDTTYTARTGFYTKIGNVVNLRFNMTINVLGTGSTTNIVGIPFDASGSQPVIVGGVVCYANNLATAALALGVYVQNGGFIRFFSRNTSSTGATNQAVSVIGSGFDVYAEVTYQV